MGQAKLERKNYNVITLGKNKYKHVRQVDPGLTILRKITKLIFEHHLQIFLILFN